jgi:hypothetical protein
MCSNLAVFALGLPQYAVATRISTRFQHGLRFVHAEVGEAIRIFVQLAPNVFEAHLTDLPNERACLEEQRLEPFVLHAILAAHLFDEELGIGLDANVAVAMLHRITKRRKERIVFGDIICCDAERPVQLFDHRAIVRFNPNAVTGRPRISAGAAIDVGGDHGTKRRTIMGRSVERSKDQEAWDAARSDAVDA